MEELDLPGQRDAGAPEGGGVKPLRTIEPRSGRVTFLHFGQGTSVRMLRCEQATEPEFVLHHSYFGHVALAVPAKLWDLLESGLGLREGAITCKRCGGVDCSKSFDAPTGARMERLRFCFGCVAWFDRAKQRRDPRSVRVSGVHYWIEPDDPGWPYQGYGGAEFRISFHDGRTVTTHNLWRQGEVPDQWRDLLPDNAQFLTESTEPSP